MIYRAALGLEIPSEIHADPDASPHATTPATLVAFLRSHRIPAYIASTVIHAEMLCPQRTPQLTLDTTDYSLAMALGRTSGHSVDLLVLCSNVMHWHCSRGASSFLRGLGEEYLVLAPSPATHEVQRDMCRVMQVFAGARECLASASSLLLQQGGRHGLSKEPLDDALVARALLRSGEYAAARDQILSGVIRRDGVASHRPHTNAIALQTLLIGARMRLDDGGLDHARALLELHRTDLGATFTPRGTGRTGAPAAVSFAREAR